MEEEWSAVRDREVGGRTHLNLATTRFISASKAAETDPSASLRSSMSLPAFEEQSASTGSMLTPTSWHPLSAKADAWALKLSPSALQP